MAALTRETFLPTAKNTRAFVTACIVAVLTAIPFSRISLEQYRPLPTLARDGLVSLQTNDAGEESTVAATISYEQPTTNTDYHMRNSKKLDKPQQQQNQWQKQPKIYVHVGPTKTASTTLQVDLRDLAEKKSLVADNYVFVGRVKPVPSFRQYQLHRLNDMFSWQCMIKSFKLHTDSHQHFSAQLANQSASVCVTRINSVLDKLRNDSKSVIVSNEHFSLLSNFFGKRQFLLNPKYYQNLHQLLEGWDVHIIMVYRRPVEWMVSSVKQANAGRMSTLRKVVRHKKWHADGGPPMLQTWGNVKKWIENSKKTCLSQENKSQSRSIIGCYTMSDNSMHVDGAEQAWHYGNFTVHTLNMHEDQHITEKLLCSVLTDTPVSCQDMKHKDRQTIINVKSTAKSVYYQIVYDAGRYGIINRDTQANKYLSRMTAELQHYHSEVLGKTMSDLPLACPTDAELAMALEFSLAKEKEMMPTWHAKPGVTLAHRNAFQKMVYTKLDFCSVRTEALLSGLKSWDELLELLNSTQRSPENENWSIKYDWIHMNKTEYP